MNIAIASDHGGFDLKEELIKSYKNQNIMLHDLGTHSTQSCDYPDIAKTMAENILNKKFDKGILICGTGIGISIAANRFSGIRAAVLYNASVAKLTREHNDANIAVFGAREQSFKDVVHYLDIFLNTAFEGGRHSTRINKMDIKDC